MKKLGKKNDGILETIEAFRDCADQAVCRCSSTTDPEQYYDHNDSLYWEIYW